MVQRSHAKGSREVEDLRRRLVEREEFYRGVLESLDEGIIITDRESRILYANARMEGITGHRREDLVGAISYQLLTPRENWPRMRRRLKERLSGKAESYEHEHVRKDGTRNWVAVRAVPYRDVRGSIVGTIGTIRCIDEEMRLLQENRYLQEEIRRAEDHGTLLGRSLALQKVLEQIRMVAPTDATVLILGESGTGKELAARTIHFESKRRGRPLVTANCAGIPEDLFESEFFGHIRGAFTGATADRPGRFDLADGGTLFLDEIGEIPLDLQGKLLRVLQEGRFEKVGDDRTRSVDVRIVAATNRDLTGEVRAGRFREDLYYRVSVFPIQMPPLRDRREDIADLVRHFLERSARKLGVPPPELSEKHLRELEAYGWPGNVRELQNVVERAVILAGGGELRFSLAAIELPSGRGSSPPSAGRKSGGSPVTLAAVKEMEREALRSALERSGGKIYGADGAAAILGLKPTTLASRLKRLGLHRETGSPAGRGRSGP